jgi:hypothetical protein
LEIMPLSSKSFWSAMLRGSKFGTAVRCLCQRPHARTLIHVCLSQTVGFINYGVVIPTLAWLFGAIFLLVHPTLEQNRETILKAYEHRYLYLNFLCLNSIITVSEVTQLWILRCRDVCKNLTRCMPILTCRSIRMKQFDHH